MNSEGLGTKKSITLVEWCNSESLNVLQDWDHSPSETIQRAQERSRSRLIRRKKASTNVDETDDSDLMATQSNGDAGLVRPPADMTQEGKGELNLEQAISLLKVDGLQDRDRNTEAPG